MQVVVGSNPTGTTIWPVRLSVRSSGFHPGKRGSTPLRATIVKYRSGLTGVCTKSIWMGVEITNTTLLAHDENYLGMNSKT